MPTAGFSDQVTFVFDVPVTAAVNCWLCDELKDALAGLTVTVTAVGGVSETMAFALPVEFPALAAMTVTVCALLMAGGAV